MHLQSNQYGSSRSITPPHFCASSSGGTNPPPSAYYSLQGPQATLENIQPYRENRISRPSHSVSMAMNQENVITGPNPPNVPMQVSRTSCVARDSTNSTGLQRFSSTLSYPVGYMSNNSGANYSARGSITGRDGGISEFHSTMAQWQSRLQQEAAQLQSLDMEEAKLNAEEVSLKEKRQEIYDQHRFIDQQFLSLQQESNEMLIKERRWYMEPIPDRKEEILQCGYQVECAQTALEVTQERLKVLEEELASLQHVVDHKKRLEQALQDLEHRFTALDVRRRKMITTADKHFDCESERIRILTGSMIELEPVVVAFCPAMGPGGDMYYGDNSATSGKQKRRRSSLVVFKDGDGGDEAAALKSRDMASGGRLLSARLPSQVLSTVDQNVMNSSSGNGGKQQISHTMYIPQRQTRSSSKRISTSETTDTTINLIGRKAAQYLKEKKEKESALQRASANRLSSSFSNSLPETLASDSAQYTSLIRDNEGGNINTSLSEMNRKSDSYIPSYLRSISVDQRSRYHPAFSQSMQSEQSNTTATSVRGTRAHRGVELCRNDREFPHGARVSDVLSAEDFDQIIMKDPYGNKPGRMEDDNGLDGGHSFCLGLDDDSTGNSMVFSLVPPTSY